MEFLVLLGPPGAGKGTLSRKLHEASGFVPFSTGELIRREMGNPASDVGRQARPFMDRGDYIPDDLALSLFFSLLSFTDSSSRLCLDGFPRTIPQAEVFLTWVAEKGHLLHGFVFLDIPLEDAVRRLGQRRICSACRAPFHLVDRPPLREGICDLCGAPLMLREDDDAERLARRQERHRTQTRPMLDWFRTRSRGLEADGRTDPDLLVKDVQKMFSLV